MKKETLFDLSMLLLRFTIGTIFISHGAQKLFGMFGGIGLEGTAKLVEGIGVGMGSPHIVAIAWGAIEFIGGIFLVLGILARWASSAIAFTILAQLIKVNLEYGFFTPKGGAEHYLLIIGACVPLILLGGGNWSLWDS